MTNVNQKTDLEELSRNWHERLKDLRLTMVSNQTGLPRQAPQPDNIAQIPTDNELFIGSVHEELSPKDIFAGDDNFYKSIEINRNVSPAPQAINAPQTVNTVQPAQPVQSLQPMMVPVWERRLSIFQISLIAAIILITAILMFEFYMPHSVPQNSAQIVTYQPQPVQSVQHVQPAQHEAAIEKVQPHTHVEQASFQIPAGESLSLKAAQEHYLKEEYSNALEIYKQLHENLSNPKEELMKDFLQLQIALCTERIGQYNQAANEFRKVLFSNSPVVRVTASYHCGLLEMQKEQYLNARTKAYQAIALIDLIDYNKDWSQSLKRDCYFLAAQSLTREVLMLCQNDKDQPAGLWPSYNAADDIFMNLDESQIRDLINMGSKSITQALLSPQIQMFDTKGDIGIYNIVCSGASIEELIAKFSAAAKIDSKWHLDSNDIGLRKQFVYLHLLSSQLRQFAVISAGCAGLISQIDDNGILNIYNPNAYSLLSDHLAVLSGQAISQWREFILRFPDDNRLANVHFALGLLYTPKDLYTESISEYKLVANHFARSPLAPYSLYNLSKIKNSVKDYRGGYEDLRQLIEQFPDSQVAINASLFCADTAGKADMLEESARLYRKVYNLALTPESQFAAAFGAGKNSYLVNDYEEAEKWLTKFTKLAANNPGTDLYTAYLYLAKTYVAMKKPEQACAAFRYAMLGVPFYLPKEEYIDVIPQMVDTYMQEGNFVQALSLLESADTSSLTPAESVQILLMQSKLLRSMGLIDKAIAVFGDRVEYTFDPQLKAQIYSELSESYIEKGDLNSASKLLSEIIVLTKPGTLMYESALKLAEVGLKLDKNSQSISVCRQLLDLEPSQEIKQKALELLASAYKQNQNYDRAALALLGQWK